MEVDDGFWLIGAVGTFFYVIALLQHRFAGPPDRPLRVNRLLAALAGSRTSYVDCLGYAGQLAAASLPLWYCFLKLLPSLVVARNPLVFPPLTFGILTGVLLYSLFQSVARRRLNSAEFLLLFGARRLAHIGEKGLVWNKLICKHCGYQEQVWNFRQMLLDEKTKSAHMVLAVAERINGAYLIPSELAEALRLASVTGCVLTPLAGGEPAKWYGLDSDHILPPAVYPPGSRKHEPYRTINCDENHGIELKKGRSFDDICYRRSSFHAPDVSSTYELFGKDRHGKRLLLVSQKVYRVLVKFDKDLRWLGRPVVLLDE